MAAWALITGDKGEGKTSLALRLAARLRQAELRVGGFVQRAVQEPDGTRIGYDLAHIERDEATSIARRGKVAGAGREGFGAHVFEAAAFARAVSWLREDAARADVLFIDEVSKLEVAGQGHAEAVRFALALPPTKVVVLCVRSEHLSAAVERFIGDGAGEVVASIQAPGGPEAERDFADRVVRTVGGETVR